MKSSDIFEIVTFLDNWGVVNVLMQRVDRMKKAELEKAKAEQEVSYQTYFQHLSIVSRHL